MITKTTASFARATFEEPDGLLQPDSRNGSAEQLDRRCASAARILIYRTGRGYPAQTHSNAAGSVCAMVGLSTWPALRANRN